MGSLDLHRVAAVAGRKLHRKAWIAQIRLQRLLGLRSGGVDLAAELCRLENRGDLTQVKLLQPKLGLQCFVLPGRAAGGAALAGEQQHDIVEGETAFRPRHMRFQCAQWQALPVGGSRRAVGDVDRAVQGEFFCRHGA